MAGPWRPPDIVALILVATIAVVMLVIVTTLILVVAHPSTSGEDVEHVTSLGALTSITLALAGGLAYWLKSYARDDRDRDDDRDS